MALFLAATATVVLAIWAALGFAWWPFANCPVCHGDGRRPSWFPAGVTRPSGWIWRPTKWEYCKSCRGGGRVFHVRRSR